MSSVRCEIGLWATWEKGAMVFISQKQVWSAARTQWNFFFLRRSANFWHLTAVRRTFEVSGDV